MNFVGYFKIEILWFFFQLNGDHSFNSIYNSDFSNINREIIFHNNNLEDKDTIFWNSQYQLKWDDFKGIPDTTLGYGAVTSVNLSLHYIQVNEVQFRIKIDCFFLKNKSWKTDNLDTNVLSHERKHFDLEEIYARKIRKFLRENNYEKIDRNTFKEGTNLRINSIFDSISFLASQTQIMYDLETNHSLNVLSQIHWNDFISNKLDELREY